MDACTLYSRIQISSPDQDLDFSQWFCSFSYAAVLEGALCNMRNVIRLAEATTSATIDSGARFPARASFVTVPIRKPVNSPD